MKTIVAAVVFCMLGHAQNITAKQKEILKNKTQISYEDLAHENPGCPENSICSPQMGKKMEKWNSFVKGLGGVDAPDNKIEPAKKIEAFRKKHGLPVPFLAKEDSIIALDPILYNSRCTAHNPKNKKNTLFKALQFFRNDPETAAAMFDPVFVYEKDETSGKVYRTPYEEPPIMIFNQSLIVPREHENLFYYMSISPKGEWKVVEPTKARLKRALSVSENADCPEDESASPGENHLKFYCKRIWNADTEKAQLVRLAWSCP